MGIKENIVLAEVAFLLLGFRSSECKDCCTVSAIRDPVSSIPSFCCDYETFQDKLKCNSAGGLMKQSIHSDLPSKKFLTTEITVWNEGVWNWIKTFQIKINSWEK